MTDRIDTAKEREKLAGLAGFTPGPWKDWQPRSDESVPVRTDGLGITIAYIHQGAVTNARNNARLIAAAPDLLASTHRLLDALDAKDAEISRLRDALKIIREWQWFEIEPHAGDIPDNVNAWAVELDDACTQMQHVARDALNPEDTP